MKTPPILPSVPKLPAAAPKTYDLWGETLELPTDARLLEVIEREARAGLGLPAYKIPRDAALSIELRPDVYTIGFRSSRGAPPYAFAGRDFIITATYLDASGEPKEERMAGHARMGGKRSPDPIEDHHIDAIFGTYGKRAVSKEAFVARAQHLRDSYPPPAQIRLNVIAGPGGLAIMGRGFRPLDAFCDAGTVHSTARMMGADPWTAATLWNVEYTRALWFGTR
jgi:hypothetical protein